MTTVCGRPRYVHAGNDIVLIAIATGLIASVLSGVY
jgi:Ni/Co efflux regulator RcnB